MVFYGPDDSGLGSLLEWLYKVVERVEVFLVENFFLSNRSSVISKVLAVNVDGWADLMKVKKSAQVCLRTANLPSIWQIDCGYVREVTRKTGQS